MVSPQSVGGYDCEFVEPPPSAFQVECPVCLLKLRNPCQVSCCGNNFCEPCIKRISSQKCPTCKTAFTTFLNKGLKRSLNQLQVHCTYHNDAGCKWKGELGQLEQHLNLNPNPEKRHVGCEFVKLECRHDCGEHPLRCLIRKHENVERGHFVANTARNISPPLKMLKPTTGQNAGITLCPVLTTVLQLKLNGKTFSSISVRSVSSQW